MRRMKYVYFGHAFREWRRGWKEALAEETRALKKRMAEFKRRTVMLMSKMQYSSIQMMRLWAGKSIQDDAKAGIGRWNARHRHAKAGLLLTQLARDSRLGFSTQVVERCLARARARCREDGKNAGLEALQERLETGFELTLQTEEERHQTGLVTAVEDREAKVAARHRQERRNFLIRLAVTQLVLYESRLLANLSRAYIRTFQLHTCIAAQQRELNKKTKRELSLAEVKRQREVGTALAHSIATQRAMGLLSMNRMLRKREVDAVVIAVTAWRSESVLGMMQDLTLLKIRRQCKVSSRKAAVRFFCQQMRRWRHEAD